MLSRAGWIRQKARGRRWAMLTAYDAPTAALEAAAGIDLILVGDSLGMVLLGYPSTTFVTMDEMVHHAKAARRGAPKATVVADMPLKGLQKGPAQALASARRFRDEAGSDAVKIEWGKDALKITDRLVQHRIPVMGHVGLTPQTAARFGVRGRLADEAKKIYDQAKAFEAHGAFAVLLECVPAPVSREITRRLSVPTIGIGSGPDCDGQVLVFHDLVGIFKDFTPRFVKRYALLEPRMRRAVAAYARDVKEKRFPTRKYAFGMDPKERERFIQWL